MQKKQIKFRVTEAERKLLERFIKKSGKTQQQYLVDVAIYEAPWQK